NKTSQSEHPAATKAGHGGYRQKGERERCVSRSEHLLFSSVLLTVPAAAAGVDSAWLGREASPFALALLKDMADRQLSGRCAREPVELGSPLRTYSCGL